MAETLTVDTTPNTETVVQSLTPDEQESLEIGEKMVAEQENLLAGKYKNAQELEKAYKELESKLGSPEKPEPSESKETVKDTTESNVNTNSTTFLNDLWDEHAKNNEFSDESLSKLKEMDQTALAQEYLNYRAANKQPKLTEADVKVLHDVAGGKSGYNDMLKWAQENMKKEEVSMFDQVMEKGDPLGAFFAVKALQYRYNDAQGVDGRLLTGKAAKPKAAGYKSQAALVAAMSDPRYDNDHAYRAEVMEKLARSDIDF